MPQRDKANREKVPFHEMELGMALEGYQYELTEAMVDRHLRATHQSEYPLQEGERLAPVSILTADGIRLVETKYDISQSVHAGQRLEVVNLPIVGTTITVRGTLVDKFEKKGRQFVALETTSEDDRGRLLARGRMVGVVRYRPEGGS